MRNRALIIELVKVATSVALLGALVGCGGRSGGKIMADTPALPYQAPDVNEIAGIEEDEDAEDEAHEEAAPAPAPAPVPAAAPAPAAKPAAPAAKVAKPAAPKAAAKPAPAKPAQNPQQ
jgi:hypothetical protein